MGQHPKIPVMQFMDTPSYKLISRMQTYLKKMHLVCNIFIQEVKKMQGHWKKKSAKNIRTTILQTSKSYMTCPQNKFRTRTRTTCTAKYENAKCEGYVYYAKGGFFYKQKFDHKVLKRQVRDRKVRGSCVLGSNYDKKHKFLKQI